jgi:hypothetical protein
MSLSSSDRPVRDLVAAADRQRRGRVAFSRVQAMAPWVAGAALIVAGVARFLGAPAWSAGLIAALAAAGLLAFWVILRRDRPTTDAIALAVDTDANLKGELRSAHWFEAQPQHDDWAAFHLTHATASASTVDWRALYPSARSARSWIVTAALTVGVIVTGLRFPARHPAVRAATFDTGAIGAELPADLKDKLARLMAQLDDAALDQDAKRASLADLKRMMATMDPETAKKLLAALDKKKADAEAKGTSDLTKNDTAAALNPSADLPDDLKWAQENEAAKTAQPQDQKAASGDQSQQSTKGGQPQSATMQAQADPNGKADSATPIVRESANSEEGKKMMGGGGPMGGDSRPGAGKTDNNVKGAAQALLAAQALRKELLEASADALGDNVDKEDLRRKTEQGKSSLGFTHVTAQGTVDPSRSAAPPPVPEPRRSLLFHYFIHR